MPEAQIGADSWRGDATKHFLVDVSDIFYFFCSGEAKGEPEGPGGGGGRFFMENPRRGGGGFPPAGGGRGGEGREGVSGEFGGGALNIFFRGRKSHQDFLGESNQPLTPILLKVSRYTSH